MPDPIQFEQRPQRTAARLEDILRRIRPGEGPVAGDPELDRAFQEWQARWGHHRDQIQERLTMLESALQPGTV